jgi:hypothetical protein
MGQYLSGDNDLSGRRPRRERNAKLMVKLAALFHGAAESISCSEPEEVSVFLDFQALRP